MDSLTLRAPEPEDIDFLFELENDQNIWNVSNNAAPYSKFQIKEFIQNHQNLHTSLQCRLIIENQGVAKGCIDVFDYNPFHSHANIGISIVKEHRDNGIGKKALNALLNYNSAHWHIKNFIAHVYENNLASLKVFESADFKKVGKYLQFKKLSNGSLTNLVIFQKENSFGN